MGDPANPQGYTSKYVDVDFTPEYPFGFGLSYTGFAYSSPRLSGSRLRSSGRLTVSADISNTGSREAEEIVQLYVGGPAAASVARPVRQLKGFRRVRLKPGQKSTVEFSITKNDVAFYNEALRLTAEPGDYQVWISPDSERGTPAKFRVE
jgi:beta-glucosidase